MNFNENEFPACLTSRLLELRIPELTDIKELRKLTRDNFDRLHPWMIWAQAPATWESTKEFIQIARNDYRTKKALHYLVCDRDTGKILGVLAAMFVKPEVPVVEFGYWLGKDAVGHSYTQTAIRIVSDMLVPMIKPARLQIRCGDENFASRRVAEQMGYKYEGCMRNSERVGNGDILNSLVFAKTFNWSPS